MEQVPRFMVLSGCGEWSEVAVGGGVGEVELVAAVEVDVVVCQG
jgi:hypothetical protein